MSKGDPFYRFPIGGILRPKNVTNNATKEKILKANKNQHLDTKCNKKCNEKCNDCPTKKED